MSEPRFFVEGLHDVAAVLQLPDDDAHKVRRVLRLRSGANLEIRDSSGQCFAATLLAVEPTVQVRLDRLELAQAPAEVSLTLAQCIPKGSKLDFIVEKATEIGIDGLIPVQSERVIGRHETVRHDRLERIARSAAQQSRSPRIPLIHPVLTWTELVERFADFDCVLMAWEVHVNECRALDALVAQVKSVLVVIGPEGGISHREAEQALARGATAISLGRRILRTETAGLVALSLLRYAAGEI